MPWPEFVWTFIVPTVAIWMVLDAWLTTRARQTRALFRPSRKGIPLRWKIQNPSEWREIRKAALARDGHRCQTCGTRKRLEVHHRVPVYKAPEMELVLSNTVTLCRHCHYYLGHRGEGWKSYDPFIAKLVSQIHQHNETVDRAWEMAKKARETDPTYAEFWERMREKVEKGSLVDGN